MVGDKDKKLLAKSATKRRNSTGKTREIEETGEITKSFEQPGIEFPALGLVPLFENKIRCYAQPVTLEYFPA